MTGMARAAAGVLVILAPSVLPAGTPGPLATLAPPSAAAEAARPGPALAQALRQGGHVVFLRHGPADDAARPAAMTELPADLRDCDGMNRPLTEAGLAQVRTTGRALQRLAIPVGVVIASPSCRCIETAWYALGRRPQLEPDLARTHGGGATLRRLLGTRPAPGTNTVVVGHLSNVLAAANVSIEQGEALVVEPTGSGTFRVVAQVAPEDWSALAP
jgi:phosphohistidine phosphatase SixA